MNLKRLPSRWVFSLGKLRLKHLWAFGGDFWHIPSASPEGQFPSDPFFIYFGLRSFVNTALALPLGEQHAHTWQNLGQRFKNRVHRTPFLHGQGRWRRLFSQDYFRAKPSSAAVRWVVPFCASHKIFWGYLNTWPTFPRVFISGGFFMAEKSC